MTFSSCGVAAAGVESAAGGSSAFFSVPSETGLDLRLPKIFMVSCEERETEGCHMNRNTSRERGRDLEAGR